MDTVTPEPLALWQAFRAAFANALSSAETALIIDAWTKEVGPRTRLYQKIMPALAASMELDYRAEVLLVDHMLCDRATRVPLVFIESENNAFSASHEIWKLCSVAAPLRVLLTVVEWDDQPGVWPAGNRREQLLGEWQSIASAQHRVWPNPGLLVVVVGERWGDRLRFYAHIFMAQTGKWQDEGLLIERNLPAA
jgi:hypothetical protein